MKRLLLIFLLYPFLLPAQTTSVTLDSCLARAIETWPGSKGTALASENGWVKQRNASNAWFPQISAGGQATWQSDVTEVTLPLPGLTLPEIPHDQYKLFLDVNQVLYDGGISASRVKMERVTEAGDSVQVVVDQRKIREAVIELYSNILYYRQLKSLAEATVERLKTRRDVLKSSAENGVLSGTDMLLFEADVLKAKQSLNDAVLAEGSLLATLSIYTGMDLSSSTFFEKPDPVAVFSEEIHRPEFSLFSLQGEGLEISKQVAGASLRPRLSAFAQGGYGRPALNMFSTEFDTYFMAGLRLNWSLYDWGRRGAKSSCWKSDGRTCN